MNDDRPPDEPIIWSFPSPPEPGSPDADSTKPIKVDFWHDGRYMFSHYLDYLVESTDRAIPFGETPPGEQPPAS